MRLRLTVLAACLISARVNAGEILNLGDPAPPLAVSAWVKGEKVEKFELGKVYVVEFWATWCIPCRASYPHLSQLAHKHKEVRFIGVDVWESNPERVKPFVDEMGDEMDFAVATDEVPASREDGGTMAKTWMKAAEEHAIPVAFIISDAKIAWIGHPLLMDEPLAKIKAGDWQPKDMARQRLAAKTKERKASMIRGSVYTPYEAGDYKAAVAAIDQGTADEPELAEEFVIVKFAALCNGADVERGLELGAKLFEANKDNAKTLNYLASLVVHKELKKDPDRRVTRFALKALQRAVELSKGEDRGCLEFLAQALLRAGDPAGAVATQERALKLLEKEVVKPNSYIEATTRGAALKRSNESLERYRAALRAKGNRP